MDDLVRVGWYCWRCHAVNPRACRSDGVPVYVPREWEADMVAELDEERGD